MAALDFKEIPPANSGPDRDRFELFAREFLEYEGFSVVEGPDRGPDDGRDLIAKEVRSGPGGETIIRWLVSCKHKVHSGTSVTPNDEANIRDRLGTHSCTGLIVVYSTLPSSGLSSILKGLQKDYGLVVYDAEMIERKLLGRPSGRTLAARFMPISLNVWMQHSQSAASSPSPDPQGIRNRFFLREPHSKLDEGLAEAAARSLLAFVVVYDPAHPLRSRLDYSLGYFMEYQTTKNLVDQHFVPIVGPSSDPQLSVLEPEDDPLENCLWVVLGAEGNVLRRESVYANPDEGMKRVREVIRRNG